LRRIGHGFVFPVFVRSSGSEDAPAPLPPQIAAPSDRVAVAVELMVAGISGYPEAPTSDMMRSAKRSTETAAFEGVVAQGASMERGRVGIMIVLSTTRFGEVPMGSSSW
jgi:hypothetical protein